MIEEIQERLKRHFDELHDRRKSIGNPVFALEHNLDPDEVCSLYKVLNQQLRSDRCLSEQQWLVWVIASTEVGYSFDGHEYWSSFGSHIESWREYGDRNSLRRFFQRFEKEYGGFRPQGKWAKQFTIISWPIANSILPKDLQEKFAFQLYKLRHELARLGSSGGEEIGRFLLDRDDRKSSRFRQLLEQTTLTSSLVLALQEEGSSLQTPIRTKTLSRIIDDLEKTRSARTWLQSARKTLRQARISPAFSNPGSENKATDPTNRKSQNAPNFVAKQNNDGTWTVGITVPAFPDFLDRLRNDARSFVGTKFRFADDEESWRPLQALFAIAGRDVPISSIAAFSSGQLFVTNRGLDEKAAALFQTSAIDASTPILMKVLGDGSAKQIRSKHVRTNADYIIIADVAYNSATIKTLKLARESINLPEATAYRLSTGSSFLQTEIDALTAIGLGYCLTAQVTPVGLPPKVSSDIDAGEWLSSEEVMIQLSSDFPVREFVVSSDKLSTCRFSANDKNEAIISLGQLEPGIYDLNIDVLVTPEMRNSLKGSVAPSRFQVQIRAPMHWTDCLPRRAGFYTVLQPGDAQLDDLVSGDASLLIIGPSQTQVVASARVYDANNTQIDQISLPNFSLPFDPKIQNALLRTLLHESNRVAIEGASRIDLIFNYGDTGYEKISFSHDPLPLRWVVKKTAQGYVAQLIDEADFDTPVKVHSFSIGTPDSRDELPYDTAIKGIKLSSPGMLLDVVSGKSHYPTILTVLESSTLRSFSDLSENILLKESKPSPKRLQVLIALSKLWSRSSAYGPLAPFRKAEVLGKIRTEIEKLVCGADWTKMIAYVRDEKDLTGIQRKIGGSPGFASRMKTTDWNTSFSYSQLEQEFYEYASTYKICGDRDLTDLAFRLAFAPHRIRSKTAFEDTDTFDRLKNKPTLAKGAFFAALSQKIRSAREQAEPAA